MSDWRDGIREGLLQSFKPRLAEDTRCSICGKQGLPLAFHAVEYYQDDREPLPDGFVPMSQSSYGNFGTIRGSFPVCVKCAPPCALCGLPRYSDSLVKFLRGLESRFNEKVHWGNGLCEHFHITDFIKRLFGDETQTYLAQMKRTRDAGQKEMNKVFDSMFGSK